MVHTTNLKGGPFECLGESAFQTSRLTIQLPTSMQNTLVPNEMRIYLEITISVNFVDGQTAGVVGCTRCVPHGICFAC